MPSRLRVFSLFAYLLVLFSVQLLAQSSSTSFVGHRTKAFKRTSRCQTACKRRLCLTPYLTFRAGMAPMR